jgi:hypothetical protein
VKPTCSHCEKSGHDEDHCWKLHLELRPKRFGGKGKRKTIATVQQDLGFDSGDETQITVVGVQGILSSHASSSSSIPSPNSERTRSELFHIRVITKHTKVDTLFYTGSQVNLISEAIVKKLGLETKPHKNPYSLGWVCDNAKLQVTKQCKLRFSITSKFVDEVELDVVPLDICGIVLGIPYLFDRKAIFFREENMYHLIKDGIKYIVRAHHMKSDLSLVTTRQLKRIVNARKNVSLMSAKAIEGCDLECNNEIVKFVPSYEVFQDSPKMPHEDSLYASIRDPVKKNRRVVNSFSVASMCSLLLLCVVHG